jgi:hypothetical protein
VKIFIWNFQKRITLYGCKNNGFTVVDFFKLYFTQKCISLQFQVVDNYDPAILHVLSNQMKLSHLSCKFPMRDFIDIGGGSTALSGPEPT